MKCETITVEVQKEMLQSVKSATEIEGLQTPLYNYGDLAKLVKLSGYHSRCVYLKAICTAGLGYEIVNVDDPNAEADPEHDKIKAVIEAQEGFRGETFVETLTNFQTDFEMFGNAYFEIARNGKGEVAEIYHLPTKDVRVGIYGNDKKSLFAKQTIGADIISFTKFGNRKEGENEFLSLMNYTPESMFYGAPEYLGCLGAIALDKSAVDFNIYRFLNKAIPESIIVVKGMDLTKKVRDEIKGFFENQFKGVENTARSLILTVDSSDVAVDIKPLSTGVQEGSFRGMRQDLRNEIIEAHGIPKRLLGISETGALGGTGEGRAQLKIFQDVVIEPKQKKLEHLLNQKIVKEGLGISKWQIKLNRLYVEDAAGDASYYSTVIGSGIISSDEARQELGYGAREEQKTDTKKPEEIVKKSTESFKELTNTIKGLRDELTGIENDSLS